jgi:hypothetical protein
MSAGGDIVVTRRTAMIVVAALAAFTLSDGAQWVMDALFHPWRFADPPLMGTWRGRVRTGDGDRLLVEFVLVRAIDPDGVVCHNCAQIEGQATTRNARDEIRRYVLFGSPRDRAGHHLNLRFKPEQEPPPDGLELSAVEGIWDGADALTLEAEFHWRKGVSAISATNDPATQRVPLRLVRAAKSE